MVARAYTVAFQGLEARPVEVQCAIAAGLPAFNLVGLPDKSVSEAKERVRAALWVSGLSFAVYCIHEPLLVVVDKSSRAGHPWWGLLGYVLLVIGAGWGLDALDRRLKTFSR